MKFDGTRPQFRGFIKQVHLVIRSQNGHRWEYFVVVDALLVVKGFKQEKDIGYDEIF